MLYSCTHMATMGVKGLKSERQIAYLFSHIFDDTLYIKVQTQYINN